VAEQIENDQQWASRNTLTEADQAMFASMGIAAWDEPSLMLAILPESPVP